MTNFKQQENAMLTIYADELYIILIHTYSAEVGYDLEKQFMMDIKQFACRNFQESVKPASYPFALDSKGTSRLLLCEQQRKFIEMF